MSQVGELWFRFGKVCSRVGLGSVSGQSVYVSGQSVNVLGQRIR